MQELFYQELLPHIRVVWRYRWQALMAAWVVALFGWVVVMSLPDRYEANARVYVDTDSILLPLLAGLAVQPDVNQRLLIMTKTLLSRPNLEQVVREADLDLKVSTPKEREQLIERLGKEVKLKGASAKARDQDNLYTLSYTHRVPSTAKQVVQVLLNILVETTLGDTRQDSESAQQFLTRQIEEYNARLVAAENRLMQFKRENFSVLPSQEGGFFQDLKQAEQSLEGAKLEMREAEFSRRELEGRLLEFIASFKQGEIKAESRYDERLESMQMRLDEKRLQFTDAHPDIIELERAIKELERLKEEELQGMDGSQSGANRPEDSRLHQELTLALVQANARIASLGVRMNEYARRALVLKEQISSLPEVEAELVGLTRDYDITNKKYDELVERLESAKLSESAGQTGDNVKFRVIDPPWVPATPSGPNRALFFTMVMGVAMGAGVGLALLIGFVRPVVYDTYALGKITDLPIYGSVSCLESSITTKVSMFKSQLPFFMLMLMFLASYGVALLLGVKGYHLADLSKITGALL